MLRTEAIASFHPAPAGRTTQVRRGLLQEDFGMTTSTDISRVPAPARRPWRLPSLAAIATTGIAVLFTYLALHDPPGVVSAGGNDVDTDFANDQWVTAGLLLAVPIVLIGFRSVWLGLASALACGVTQFVIAEVVVERYATSDWSDGLEGLAYVYALLVTGSFLTVALVGAGVGRWRRRAASRRAGTTATEGPQHLDVP
ncbi:hypothetical protein [Cryptosporangium sp. NPDC051539]|uniref:hypothetical protein n=1 Tax=Cryptosporangium sp. NPDC051539 TaxID=3363962 RepID=UPI0037BBF21A